MGKIEDSVHFHEIEDMILQGESDRYISKWLEEEYNEKISHVTIYNYKKDYLDVDAEAAKQYREEERRKQLQPHIQKRLDDIGFCDKIIQAAAMIDLEVDLDNKITPVDIYKLGLSALDKKRKMLADAPKRSGNTTIVIPNDKESRAKGRALAVEFMKQEEE